MNILIVEDDENKRTRIVSFLKERFEAPAIITAKSLQSGLRLIIEGGVELVILDMTMPTFDIGVDEDGGRLQAYAGREILNQMDRRDIVVPVIVVTQFDEFGVSPDILTLQELDLQLQEAYPEIYAGAVYYNVSEEGWKESLLKLIAYVDKPAR